MFKNIEQIAYEIEKNKNIEDRKRVSVEEDAEILHFGGFVSLMVELNFEVPSYSWRINLVANQLVSDECQF